MGVVEARKNLPVKYQTLSDDEVIGLVTQMEYLSEVLLDAFDPGSK